MDGFKEDFLKTTGTALLWTGIAIGLIVVFFIIRYFFKKITPIVITQPKTKKKDQEQTDTDEDKDSSKKTFKEWWDGIPQSVKTVCIVLLVLLLLKLGAPSRNVPRYAQVIEKEVVLDTKNAEEEFEVHSGDSVCIHTELTHLTVWQGTNAHVGETKHYGSKDWLKIFPETRFVRISPCHGHYGKLIYKVYRK